MLVSSSAAGSGCCCIPWVSRRHAAPSTLRQVWRCDWADAPCVPHRLSCPVALQASLQQMREGAKNIIQYTAADVHIVDCLALVAAAAVHLLLALPRDDKALRAILPDLGEAQRQPGIHEVGLLRVDVLPQPAPGATTFAKRLPPLDLCRWSPLWCPAFCRSQRPLPRSWHSAAACGQRRWQCSAASCCIRTGPNDTSRWRAWPRTCVPSLTTATCAVLSLPSSKHKARGNVRMFARATWSLCAQITPGLVRKVSSSAMTCWSVCAGASPPFPVTFAQYLKRAPCTAAIDRCRDACGRDGCTLWQTAEQDACLQQQVLAAAAAFSRSKWRDGQPPLVQAVVDALQVCCLGRAACCVVGGAISKAP